MQKCEWRSQRTDGWKLERTMIRKSSRGRPADLARAFSLRRANSRAKSKFFRPENAYCQKPRISESIEALYMLATLKDATSQDMPLQLSNVDISSIQDRVEQGRELWDREFSSLSSCACNQDNISEEKVVNTDTMLSMRTDWEKLFINDATFHIRKKISLASEDRWSEEKPFGIQTTRKSSLTRRKIASFSSFLPADVKGAVRNSVAIVKHSNNPYKDFLESMYEIVAENGLEERTDFQELLYCYLCLNVQEHHDIIKKAFIDVWTEVQLMKLPDFKVGSF